MATAMDEGGGTSPVRKPPEPEIRKSNISITNLNSVRHITVKAKNESNNLCKLGPFAISKYIEYIVQTSGSVTPQHGRGRHTSRHNQNTNPDPSLISYTIQYRTSSLLIKTTNGKQTQQIYKAKKFGDIDIITSIPIGPNTCRGVVNVWGFRDLEEKILIKDRRRR